jgi:hypothetical protein
MKSKYIMLPVLIVCFLFTSEVIAQGYESPSRERVETLLEQLEDCKDTQKELENNVINMELDPESVTLKEYNEAQRYANNAKACANILREKLDALRKDYPGWFNDPNATISVKKPVRKNITPREMQKYIDQVNESLETVLARLQALKPYGH